jgi:hypothetical protein
MLLCQLSALMYTVFLCVFCGNLLRKVELFFVQSNNISDSAFKFMTSVVFRVLGKRSSLPWNREHREPAKEWCRKVDIR